MTLYEELVAAGCEIENHESDLYVVVSEAALSILAGYEFRSTLSFFASEGRRWVDVPFAFDPFWAVAMAHR